MLSRMGMLKGEAGASPALSRNCELAVMKCQQARSPAQAGVDPQLRGKGGGNVPDQTTNFPVHADRVFNFYRSAAHSKSDRVQ
jgi:hypothetical protein